MTLQPDPTPTDADLDGVLEYLPDGTSQQGHHDQAGERSRAIRALTLRVVGNMTYAQIAEQMGYREPSSVRQLVMRALDRHEAESVVQMRVMENARLDADEMVLRTIALDRNAKPGDRIRAVTARTGLSARRARMNGLDAPVAVQISAGVGAELDDALAAASQLLDTIVGETLAVHDEPLPDTP